MFGHDEMSKQASPGGTCCNCRIVHQWPRIRQKVGDWCIAAGTLMVILLSLVAVLGSDKSASTQYFANFSMSSNWWGEVLILVVVLQWRYPKFWWVDLVLVIFKKASRFKLKLFSGSDSSKLFQNVTIDNSLGVVSRRNVSTITKSLQYWRENKTHSIIYTLQIKLARIIYFTIDSLVSSVVSILKVTIGACAQVQIGQPWSRYLPWLVFIQVEQTIPGPNWETGHVTLSHSDPYWILGLLKFEISFKAGRWLFLSFIILSTNNLSWLMQLIKFR
jgi:hypothetical protein